MSFQALRHEKGFARNEQASGDRDAKGLPDDRPYFPGERSMVQIDNADNVTDLFQLASWPM
jgi:hypothetical protein